MANQTIDQRQPFTLRLNPWDERAFGFRVTEILAMNVIDDNVLGEIDRRNREMQARLCCFRHDSGDLAARKRLLSAGFYVSEHSFVVTGLLSKVMHKRSFELIEARASHVGPLREIVARDFKFSRFHEDPYIDPSLAAKRNQNWVQDLVKEGKCRVAENEKKDVIGFFAYGHNGDDIRLILAGINSRYKGFGLLFWLSVMDHLQEKGKTVSALISAANIEAVNIYTRLGFTVTRSLFDYHKRY